MPVDQVFCAGSCYFAYLTIVVDDQFGYPLHQIYTGAEVTERGGESIAQTISSSGTYEDPVGFITNGKGIKNKEEPKGITNPYIAYFLSLPILPALNVTQNQNVPVEVDGHPLNPGIVNRLVELTPPNHIKITWPSP